MHFGNGLHSITFYLKDGYGNVTRETRYFTVDAEQTDVPSVSLELQGQPTVGKTWELALSSSDPASITSLSSQCLRFPQLSRHRCDLPGGRHRHLVL